jgi:hypothetical protein
MISRRAMCVQPKNEEPVSSIMRNIKFYKKDETMVGLLARESNL